MGTVLDHVRRWALVGSREAGRAGSSSSFCCAAAAAAEACLTSRWEATQESGSLPPLLGREKQH